VQRFPITARFGHGFSIQVNNEKFFVPESLKRSDGSYLVPGGGSLYLETQEWKDKYQDSLHIKVTTDQIWVYYVYSMQKGKRNSRCFFVDGEGLTYHGIIPTMPPPVRGFRYLMLRCELTPVSLIPDKVILNNVLAYRKEHNIL
jgi:hypothetical protein